MKVMAKRPRLNGQKTYINLFKRIPGWNAVGAVECLLNAWVLQVHRAQSSLALRGQTLRDVSELLLVMVSGQAVCRQLAAAAGGLLPVGGGGRSNHLLL